MYCLEKGRTRGTPALHLNEAADGKLLCCWLRFGLVLLLYLYDIRLFEPKKFIYFNVWYVT